MSDLPDHVRRNRALWDNWAQQYVATGEENWAAAEPTWGIWGVPESQLKILPVRPAVGATTRYPFVTLEWAAQ